MSPAANEPAGRGEVSAPFIGRLRALVGRLAAPHALLLHAHGLWDAGSPRAPHRELHAHASFAAWCANHPGAACTLWLSGALLHELVCDPALPLPDEAALLAYAAPLFVHYHGPAASDWALAPWRAGGEKGVSALHGVALTALQADARAAGVHVRAVRPWWSRLLPLALRQQPALAAAASARLLIVEGRHVTSIGLSQGDVVTLQQRLLAHTGASALAALIDEQPAGGPCAALGHGFDAAAGSLPGLSLIEPLDRPSPPPLWLLARP